jgi:hypothetical protein
MLIVTEETRQNMIEQYVDTEQAARIIHIEPGTLQVWRYRKRGPSYVRYSHRCVRYKLSDVLAWIERHRVEVRPAVNK